MRWLDLKWLALIGFLFIPFLPGFAQPFSITSNPFQYDDEYKDPGTPLLYLNARYLNQDLGIAYFISHDYGEARKEKALFDGDYNAFAGNPIMNQDPSGHGIFPAKMIQDGFNNILAEAAGQAYNDALQAAASLFEQAEQENLNAARILGDTVYIPHQWLLQRQRQISEAPEFTARYLLSVNHQPKSFFRFAESNRYMETAIGRFSAHPRYDQNLVEEILSYGTVSKEGPITTQYEYENKSFVETDETGLVLLPTKRIETMKARILGLPEIPRNGQLRLAFAYNYNEQRMDFDAENSCIYRDRLIGEFMTEQKLYSVKLIDE